MGREPFEKSIKLSDGVLQKFVVKDADFPQKSLFGPVVIPFWVFDRFDGEKVQHILLHEKKHADDTKWRWCSLIVLFVLWFLVQGAFDEVYITLFIAFFTYLPVSWFFENRADKYAAKYVGKQQYAETLKEYEAALEQEKGRLAVILEWFLHLPYCIREKLI
jgi:hypothetical protein